MKEPRKRKTGTTKAAPAGAEQTLLTAEPPPIPAEAVVAEEKEAEEVEPKIEAKSAPAATVAKGGTRKIDASLLPEDAKVEPKPTPTPVAGTVPKTATSRRPPPPTKTPPAKKVEPKVEVSPSFKAAIEAAKIEEGKETVVTKVPKVEPDPKPIETDVVPRRTRTALEIETGVRPPVATATRTKVEPKVEVVTVTTKKTLEPTPVPTQAQVKVPVTETKTPRRPPADPPPTEVEEWKVGNFPTHVVFPVTGSDVRVREIQPEPESTIPEPVATARIEDRVSSPPLSSATKVVEVAEQDGGDGDSPPRKEGDRTGCPSCWPWVLLALAVGLLFGLLPWFLFSEEDGKKISNKPVVTVVEKAVVPAPEPVIVINPCGQWGTRAEFVRHHMDELRRPGNPLEDFSDESFREGAEWAATLKGCF